MQKVEVLDDEEGEEEEQVQIYDLRAGQVNVNLPQLKFHVKAVSKALLQCRFAKETNSKLRKCLTELAEHFRKLGSGTYPLGVKKVKLATDDYDTNVRKAVNRLVKFDKKIKGTKYRKRKAENEMQLRGGKRVKIDEKLREMLQDDLVRVVKKKRMFIDDTPESPPEKQRKKELKLQVEFIIKRNSGTWLVTKAVQRELKKVNEEKVLDKNNEKEKVTCKTPNIIYPKNKREVSKNKEKKVSGSKPNIIFPKNKWENSNNHTTDEPEKILRNSRLSLPTNLIKNPFSNSSPVKKVKINTKLNRSQDVQEHHAQILSSPGIPYDAQKKPSKPLLKTPTMTSPINPFYVL